MRVAVAPRSLYNWLVNGKRGSSSYSHEVSYVEMVDDVPCTSWDGNLISVDSNVIVYTIRHLHTPYNPCHSQANM